MQFEALSDTELLDNVVAACVSSQQFVARIVAQLAEIERRRLYLDLGYSSMLPFCEEYLRMGKGEACRRLIAARIVERHPMVLGMLERGEIRLEGLSLLNRYIGSPHGEAMLLDAAGKTTAQIQEIIAKYFPSAEEADRLERAVRPKLTREALDRHKLTLMLTEEDKDELLMVRDLMSHTGANFLDVFRAAVKGLRKRLEKKTSRAVKAKPSKDASYVPRAVRRETLKEAEAGCEFTARDGKRCGSRERLQVDHRHPKALGGSGEKSNVRLLCQAHNLQEARRVLGTEQVDQHLIPRAVRDAESALRNAGFAAKSVRQALVDLGEMHSKRTVQDLFKLIAQHLTPKFDRSLSAAEGSRPPDHR